MSGILSKWVIRQDFKQLIKLKVYNKVLKNRRNEIKVSLIVFVKIWINQNCRNENILSEIKDLPEQKFRQQMAGTLRWMTSMKKSQSVYNKQNSLEI